MAHPHAKPQTKSTTEAPPDSVAAVISRIRKQQPGTDEEIRRAVRRVMVLY